LLVRVLILAQRDIPKPIFAVRIRNAKGVDIYGTNTSYRKVPTPDLRQGERIEVIFAMAASVLGGQYFISAGCSHFEGDKLIVHHRRYDALEITVRQDEQSFGIVQCNAQITTRVIAKLA
jgi:lipopolysaccharide transport system ATP-binding protein